MNILQDHWLQILWRQDPGIQGISNLWRTPKHSSLFYWLLDAWEDKNTWPPSSIKTPDLQAKTRLMLLFLSESPRCLPQLYLLFLYLQYTLLSFPAGSCLISILHEVKDPLWAGLQNPLCVFGSGLPTWLWGFKNICKSNIFWYIHLDSFIPCYLVPSSNNKGLTLA